MIHRHSPTTPVAVELPLRSPGQPVLDMRQGLGGGLPHAAQPRQPQHNQRRVPGQRGGGGGGGGGAAASVRPRSPPLPNAKYLGQEQPPVREKPARQELTSAEFELPISQLSARNRRQPNTSRPLVEQSLGGVASFHEGSAALFGSGPLLGGGGGGRGLIGESMEISATSRLVDPKAGGLPF